MTWLVHVLGVLGGQLLGRRFGVVEQAVDIVDLGPRDKLLAVRLAQHVGRREQLARVSG